MENAGRTMMGDRQQKGSRKEQRFKDDQFESKIPGNNPPMSFFTYIFTLKVDKKFPRPMDSLVPKTRAIGLHEWARRGNRKA